MKSLKVRAALTLLGAAGLVSFVLLSALQALAQSESFLSAKSLERIADLDFDTFGTRDGLPHQSVYGFTQDTTGFLWIASYGGLSRFDGYRIRTYTHDAGRPSSLRDNNLRWVVPAAHGDLWLGSDTAGVSYYRATTDSFEGLADAPPEVKSARIYCMASDGHDGVWAGGQFGIIHFDALGRRREFFHPQAGTASEPSIPLKRVFSVFVDRAGTLWVGGDAGVARLPAGGTRFESIGGLDGEGEVGVHPSSWTFLEDHRGRLWVGCDHVGLAIYDPAHRVLRGVPGMSGRHSELGEHTVRGIVEHIPGELWIATYGGGLVTYTMQDGYSRSFVKVSTKPYPLHNNFLRGIFRDRSGVVWLATDNGAARINDSTTGIFQIHPTLADASRFSGTEIRSVGVFQGSVWVGFDQGEFGMIGEDAVVRQIPPARGVGELVTRREILAIKGFDADTVYAAGTGLYRIDLKSRTFRPVADPLITSEVLSSLCADGPRIWAGTYNGLYVQDVKAGRGRMYHHDPADPASLSENDIRDLLLQRDGRLWVGTRSGLNLFVPASDSFRVFRHNAADPESMPSDNVRAFAEDRAGRLWIATTGAGLAVLLRWTPEGKPVFKTLNTQTGLPSDAVLTLTLGKDGRLWANTAEGLAVVNPETLAVQRYGGADGLRSAAQKLFGSVTLEDGTLLFRGPDGLIAVQPNHLEQRIYRAPLVITDLALTGDARPTPIHSDDLNGAVSGSIRLNPRHRAFTAEVALLDYTGPESTIYSYQLAGVDPRWIQLPAGTRTITYDDLHAGHFQLHIRAISRSGQGPVVESTYQVEAPRMWTESVAFRILTALGIIALVFLLIQLRTAFLSHRRQQLEQEITERTVELNEKRELLEKANLMLGQLAVRDPLTNLFNRRHFLDLAEIELLRTRRSDRTMSLLLLDIDHFKTVNDTYGHLAGDEVIRFVAAQIGQQLRASDTLARFGGEEYVVLLPETDLTQAGMLAERILTAVASTPANLDQGGSIQVTVSIGAAQADLEASLTQLIERTDKALYRAKLERNRVQIG